MSWRPPFENKARGRDPRLDPYRERAAILTSGGDPKARLYIRIETYWTQIGGHLWWRQWSEPYEVAHGYMILADGSFDDWVVRREELDEDLANWPRNKLSYFGEILDVEWLDDTASRQSRDDIHGLDAPE
jgi:hypothetical protein